MDEDGDNLVSKREFLRVVTKELGYTGPRTVLERIYSEIDDDGTGTVQFDELKAWLRGQGTDKASRMVKVGQLQLTVELPRLHT